MRRVIVSGLALAPAGANVIMQLSRLPIGHAIAESVVHSGSLTKHPIKRTRTTLGYVMISLFGTDHERDVMRAQVNAQHATVKSTPRSLVVYNAFDPELQLWVAACMYRGVLDAATFLHGEVDEGAREALLTQCARFATTLQVPVTMWPNDVATFTRYWDSSLEYVQVDEITRQYLLGIASLTFLPTPLARLLGRPHRFLTTGFLPQPFRDQLGLSWSSRDQVLFDKYQRVAGLLNRSLPRHIREFPWNAIEWDTRRRIRQGRSIV
jgi:uncharacterized protein (DUF2236 family)